MRPEQAQEALIRTPAYERFPPPSSQRGSG